MHFYDGYHFWGMHLIWWAIWIVLLVLIFLTPWTFPLVRKKGSDAMDILKKRYAAGEITTDEYLERKKVLEEEK